MVLLQVPPAERRSVVRRRFRERTLRRDGIRWPALRETRPEQSEINNDGESTTVGKFVIFHLRTRSD